MRISICIIHQSTLFVGRDNLDLTSGTLSKLSGVDSTGGMSGTCGWSSKQLQLPRANFVQTSVRVCGHAHTWYPVENGRIHPEVPSLSKSLQDLTGVLKCCTSTVYKNVYSQKPGIPERWPYLRLMSWPVLPTWHFLTFPDISKCQTGAWSLSWKTLSYLSQLWGSFIPRPKICFGEARLEVRSTGRTSPSRRLREHDEHGEMMRGHIQIYPEYLKLGTSNHPSNRCAEANNWWRTFWFPRHLQ